MRAARHKAQSKKERERDFLEDIETHTCMYKKKYIKKKCCIYFFFNYFLWRDDDAGGAV